MSFTIFKNLQKNKTSLKIEDVCTIIRTCATNAVRSIEYGELKIKFYPNAATPITVPLHLSEEIKTSQETQARESIEKKEMEMKEEMLSQLQIEDPVGFEKLLASGELTDG